MKSGKCLWRLLIARWNLKAKIGKPLAHCCIGQCFSGERGEGARQIRTLASAVALTACTSL